MTRQRPLFAVLYDLGAVPAGEIGAGLADLGDVVFLVPRESAHVAQLRPVMEMLGEVRTLTGDTATDVRLLREISPDAVLNFCEHLVRQAAEFAAALGLPGNSPHTARLFTDKALQRRTLREKGVEKTVAHPLDTLGDWDAALAAVGLPAVVKPVAGALSRQVHALRDKEEAAAVHARLAALEAEGAWVPFVVEEYLEGRPCAPFGDFVSVESLCLPTGITHLAVTGKTPVMPPFRSTGRIWPSPLPQEEEQEVADLVTRALEAIGAERGFAHTEVKLTPDGPRIIELNGRLSGFVNMMSRESCDLDLVRIGALAALGEPMALAPFSFGGRVHFQYNNLAPLRPCRLEAVHGAEAVRALPGVTTYRAFAHPGDDLPGGTMTSFLDAVSGVCDSHEAVVCTIEAVRSALTFDLRFDDGARAVNGMDLPHY
jgi:biotin carboxylase